MKGGEASGFLAAVALQDMFNLGQRTQRMFGVFTHLGGSFRIPFLLEQFEDMQVLAAMFGIAVARCHGPVRLRAPYAVGASDGIDEEGVSGCFH